MLSVQNEQTKEKTELQKGDEKKSEIIPDNKLYEPPRWKEILACVCIIPICVLITKLSDTKIVSNVGILSFLLLLMLWWDGFFSKQISKKRKIKILTIDIVGISFCSYMAYIGKWRPEISIICVVVVFFILNKLYTLFFERRVKK